MPSSPDAGDTNRRPYRLEDRYLHDEGRVFASGVQILARLPFEQLRRDRADGHNTAAFVCGYPGSPLATLDMEFARVASLAETAGLQLVHQPGLNEELAAAAVMGSQLVAGFSDATSDGVLGVWYGKAPGLDRACDAMRHATLTGTSPLGGAVMLVGDDPYAKSSTVASSSEGTLAALRMPFLVPGDPQEALDLGRHAIAMSRSCGVVTALRIVAGVADGTASVDLSGDALGAENGHGGAAAPYRLPLLPGHDGPAEPYRHRPNGNLMPPYTTDIERDLVEVRLELARSYGSRNELNRLTTPGGPARVGIVAAGNCFPEMLEALRLLGLADVADIAGAGIRLAKVSLPYPLEDAFVRSFADGLAEVIVVEEKDPHLELFVKDALYPLADRPVVVGKRDDRGEPLLARHAGLDADALTGPLHARLVAHLSRGRLGPPPAPPRQRQSLPVNARRTPYFCSGCPHNSSTRVPDGSLVGVGIGCHGMVSLMDPERVGEWSAVCSMGAEGATWVGMSPFTQREHTFQNLGDGTYAHSGQLGIQFAVAAGVNITFKLLYNGAVAMTGGQDPTGIVGVPEMAKILLAQGVRQVLITTEDLGRYKRVALPTGVEVWDRKRLMEAQERLQAVEGVTVLIHDQFCAAELRRARRRGQQPRPDTRVLINERVCEGCGDCGDVSNCLSVQPVDTPYGRKTKIDQTTCNFDYSCIDGDCPSFATVRPARAGRQRRIARKRAAATRSAAGRVRPQPPDDIAEPTTAGPASMTVRMAGIGGTGVVTASHLLGTAALLSGRHVQGLDQTGLSQKAGPVVSDVRISATAPIASNKATAGMVDLFLAFDLLTAAAPDPLAGASPERTLVVASVTPTSTGQMVVRPEQPYPSTERLRSVVDASSRAAENRWVDAGAVTRRLFGNTTSANVFLIGVAFQCGALPITAASFESAIDLNGVATERNREAFRWGRQWAIDPEGVELAAANAAAAGASAPPDDTAGAPQAPGEDVLEPTVRRLVDPLAARTGLAELLEMLSADLSAYQSARYAEDFLHFVAEAAEAEEDLDGWELTETVARNLHKLMAYKDEYEVARLLLEPEAVSRAEEVAGPGARLLWHLHPPFLRALGVSRKLKLGRWARPLLVALRSAKRLRGTPLDVFGYAGVRRCERRLPQEYREAIRALLENLDAVNRDEAVEIADLPEGIRGYEDLKMSRVATYREELRTRVARFGAAVPAGTSA
ncbi:MAG: indolepyruvate ferredoxin oxidoreductase family protein [bacterium]|nr:indolepyruvate ferredoxin oxidoreductase family protein [bacterium]MDE0669799.1 indolepyruvate ferredoxin oxidoreductase family protein [bacterium]MXZ30607.1 indolepyruvate ferredoxin oxidoreductase family protein [Acidimicrobiia bacterium]MYB24314.1 indolepyruvate ferredoxin oxidoreductase family protein [Acidimicrobiia bacterium]